MKYEVVDKAPEVGGLIRIIDNPNISPELTLGNYVAGDVLRVDMTYHDGIVTAREARSRYNLGGLIFKGEYEVVEHKVKRGH